MPADKSFLFKFLKLFLNIGYLVQGEPVDLSECVEPQVPLPVHSGEIRLLTVQSTPRGHFRKFDGSADMTQNKATPDFSKDKK
jgi:hypothetical protein